LPSRFVFFLSIWHSYGNEGAQMTGRDGTGNPNFYNAPSHKATKTSKLLVGSTFVDTSKKVGGASVHSRG
jgi:hypothetical protein